MPDKNYITTSFIVNMNSFYRCIQDHSGVLSNQLRQALLECGVDMSIEQQKTIGVSLERQTAKTFNNMIDRLMQIEASENQKIQNQSTKKKTRNKK